MDRQQRNRVGKTLAKCSFNASLATKIAAA